MNNMTKNLVLWLVIAMVLLALFSGELSNQKGPEREVAYSTFLDMVERGQVQHIEVQRGEQGENKVIQIYKQNLSTPNGKQLLYTVVPIEDKDLATILDNHKVEIKAKNPKQPSFLAQMLISWLPILLIIGVWIYLMRNMTGGGSGGRGAMSFGKSKARMLTDENNNTKFADVAGCEEAKEEVTELVEFLVDPGRFQKLGGHIPRGMLMTGNPGVGKTLLAKAIAGEARAPFFSISGSDFVEMFVGVGASRVRDMFEQAKKHAPCIIFIDEIDAVGRQRGAGHGGGHDEREQTLNQLLVEMDGMETTAGVIVIAATNRPDVLDPALMRPGRFDRQVHVPLPDIRGREQIFKVHARRVPLAEDVSANVIARGTPGFSGADIANLVNEAALFAARANKKLVDMEDFENAKDKVIMGTEHRSRVMPEDERMNTAYHESGHTVVAKVLGELTDPVHKVTIIPRGRALGVTMQLPEEDRYNHNREFLEARIAVLCGGRIAEEVFMNQMTTGASNDFEHATDLAENMVKKWGMGSNEKLGHRVYGGERSQPFAGQIMGYGKQEDISPETQALIDLEINKIIDEQYDRARGIIEENREKIEVMAQALMEWETLDADQIGEIMEGNSPTPPPAPPLEPEPLQPEEGAPGDEDESKDEGGKENSTPPHAPQVR